jgi:hypothetical protein
MCGRGNPVSKQQKEPPMLNFKEIESDVPLKVQELTEPLVGTYQGVETGKYSPIYLIHTEDGLKRIVGVTDLQQKMEKVRIGSLVRIALKEARTTDTGKLYLTTVEVARE